MSNLSTREKASYGLGAVGKDMVYAFVSGFLMIYFNEVLGISGKFIGVLFMAARIFDAVNDPFMGIIVEKTHSRMGKFRPWLLLGTLLNAIILIAMFSVPTSLTGIGLKVYISVCYILWGITYTIMDIPYWSMIPTITEPGKDRENLSVIARSCASFGYAIPTILTVIIVPILGRGNYRVGYQLFASIIAIFFIVAILVTFLNVKEHHYEAKETVTIKQMFSSLVHNDQALVMVVAIITFNASLYLTNQLAVYFFKYDIGNEQLFSIFGMIGGAAQIVAMLCFPLLRKFFECKKLLVLAISSAIFGYAALFILGCLNINHMVLICLAAIFVFLGFGLATVLTTIFLADTVDYGEWKYAQRNESVIFSLQTFVVKLASAFSVLIAGIGIDLIHLNKADNAIQTASTLLGLRILMLIIPMIGLIFSIIFFAKKYKLDETFLRKIKTDLAEKKVG